MRVLIAAVSAAEATDALVERLGCERVALLATPSLREEAEVVQSVLATRLEGGARVEVREEDPNDATAWHRVFADVIARERAAGREVLVDVTGGKKPMSLGAYAAAEAHGAPVVYLVHDISSGRPQPTRVSMVPSIREALGLDWLVAADEAFARARFDTAARLYERAGHAGARVDVLVRLANARQAWLEGHYRVACRLWPDPQPRPVPWNLLAGRLTGRRESALEEDAFAAWLDDRRRALALRLAGGHGAPDVARSAWQFLETLLRFVLSRWLQAGATLTHGGDSLGPADVQGNGGARLTVGPLLGLVVEGTAAGPAGRLRLTHAPGREQRAVEPSLRELRGAQRGALHEGLEVRNGLAHGYADLGEVERWVGRATRPGGSLEALVTEVLGWLPSPPSPGPLENPRAWRERS